MAWTAAATILKFAVVGGLEGVLRRPANPAPNRPLVITGLRHVGGLPDEQWFRQDLVMALVITERRRIALRRAPLGVALISVVLLITWLTGSVVDRLTVLVFVLASLACAWATYAGTVGQLDRRLAAARPYPADQEDDVLRTAYSATAAPADPPVVGAACRLLSFEVKRYSGWQLYVLLGAVGAARGGTELRKGYEPTLLLFGLACVALGIGTRHYHRRLRRRRDALAAIAGFPPDHTVSWPDRVRAAISRVRHRAS